MTNPLYDPFAVLQKVYGGGAYLKQALNDTPIEEAHRARTAKVCYGVLENDIYLDFCIKSFAPKSPKLPVRILLKVALYFLLFLGKARYMVTDSAVSLNQKAGQGRRLRLRKRLPAQFRQPEKLTSPQINFPACPCSIPSRPLPFPAL